MRSEAQKKAFALNCQEIEKKGEDVLGFIQKNWPSYTPRATWYNLQKRYLHRQPWQLTEGKPKPKEAEDMNDRKEIAYALKDGYYENGEEIRTFLEDCGYADASNGLSSVKDWAKKNDPECYEAIRNLTIRGPQKRKPSETAQNGNQTSQAVSPKDDSPKAAEAPRRAAEQETEAHRGGYVSPEEMAKEFARQLGEKAGSVVTCCAPARPSGVTVPDEIPDESSNRQVKPAAPVRKKPRVTEVETDLGSFRKEEGKIAFRRVDDGKDYKNQLKMAREQWLQLAAEMDEVLEMLEEIDY